MAVDFYYGSGSPYAWRVWLALEHKAIAYELKLVSFDRGDTKSPAYTALNPRQRVPVLVHDGFAMYESAAIVEYVDDAFPGAKLFANDVRQRAVARRLVREADEYLAHALEVLVGLVFYTAPEQQDAAAIAAGRDAFVEQLAFFERALQGEFFAGGVGAADFTIYPIVALVVRMEKRRLDLRFSEAIPPKLRAWMKRVESLPYFDKTYPPHWKS